MKFEYIKSFTKDEANELRKLIISYLLRHDHNKLKADLPQAEKALYLLKYSTEEATTIHTQYEARHFYTKQDILKYLKSIDKY